MKCPTISSAFAFFPKTINWLNCPGQSFPGIQLQARHMKTEFISITRDIVRTIPRIREFSGKCIMYRRKISVLWKVTFELKKVMSIFWHTNFLVNRNSSKARYPSCIFIPANRRHQLESFLSDRIKLVFFQNLGVYHGYGITNYRKIALQRF